MHTLSTYDAAICQQQHKAQDTVITICLIIISWGERADLCQRQVHMTPRTVVASTKSDVGFESRFLSNPDFWTDSHKFNTGHCMLLSPGNFNSMILIWVPIYRGSFITIVATVFLDCCSGTKHSKKHSNIVKLRHKIEPLSRPAQSPDLNIIENVWLRLKNTLQRNTDAITCVEQLKAAITTAWTNVPNNYIHWLYNSIPRHLRAVLTSKGNITKY